MRLSSLALSVHMLACHRHHGTTAAPERTASNQWRCTSGQYIPKSYNCDGGQPDCQDGSDERGCHDTTAG